ncbi:FAD-dependent oxidoreductase [Sulfurimonas sp. CS5]|uniref:FAD-dependent oxidoreductase n=1 Tax=Sulfurimonas sp. CS5 TaxID=3391145 RepID=UPI0039E96A0B
MKNSYDAIVLGAGINGVAIAKALAIAEKKVLVIEKNHIASGASSNSSRLIHGGLRYLEQYEFSLIRESLKDQKYLLDTYPSLVKLHPFYFPIYNNSKRPDWMIGLGLWLYSLFSKHGKKALKVSKEEFFSEFKNIKDNNIRAIFKTNLFINATGAWIDEINKEFNLPSSYTIEKVSGIHIVIESLLIPEPLLLETACKRIFFMIPEDKTTIIGTTERSVLHIYGGKLTTFTSLARKVVNLLSRDV